MRRLLALAIALAGLAVPTVSAAQPIVRVRAETRIELQVSRSPRVRVTATLRDDRGDPLRDRPLTVQITEEHGAASERATEDTDENGRIELDFTVPQTGSYRLRARFPGDANYREVEVAEDVDLDRAHVRLSMSAELGRLDRLNLDLPTHSVRVRAESEVGGQDLEVRLENEMRQALASGTTGSDGTVLLEVRSLDLGGPAAGRVVVRTEGDARRAAAQTEVLVVRYRPTDLSLLAHDRQIEAGRPVLLEGRLMTSRGPLTRKAVGIFAGDRHLETVLTDDTGRFERRVVLEENEGEITLSARFESDAPWRPEAMSGPLVITVEPRGATPAPWLMIPIATCLLGLMVIWWRTRRSKPGAEKGRRSTAPAPPGIQLGEPGSARQASRADVGGIVLDADESSALAGARISLCRGAEKRSRVTNADGGFQFDSVPNGAWILRAERAGHESRETTVEIPHRGRLSRVEIRLSSLRQLVLRSFRPLAEALAPSRRWWAFWTPRELADRARGKERRQVTEVAREVEEIAYAAPLPEAERVEKLGKRAARLAEDLREDSSAR